MYLELLIKVIVLALGIIAAFCMDNYAMVQVTGWMAAGCLYALSIAVTKNIGCQHFKLSKSLAEMHKEKPTTLEIILRTALATVILLFFDAVLGGYLLHYDPELHMFRKEVQPLVVFCGIAIGNLYFNIGFRRRK